MGYSPAPSGEFTWVEKWIEFQLQFIMDKYDSTNASSSASAEQFIKEIVLIGKFSFFGTSSGQYFKFALKSAQFMSFENVFPKKTRNSFSRIFTS